MESNLNAIKMKKSFELKDVTQLASPNFLINLKIVGKIT